MSNSRKITKIIFALILACTLAACGGDGGKKGCGCPWGDVTCSIACAGGDLPGLPDAETPTVSK